MTTARQITVISKTPNGWCSVKMRVTPATNHVTTDKLFGWRVQTVECHGQNLTVASEYDVPMWFDDHGNAHSYTAQCGSCGSRYAATFTEGDQQ